MVADGLRAGHFRMNRRQVLGAAGGLMALTAPAAQRGSALAAEIVPATTIFQVPNAGKMVALTFDVELDPGRAPSILDTLAKTGVKTSWGLTGKWADANSDLVTRIAAEGHQIINHTYTHRSFTGPPFGSVPLTREERLDELARSEAGLKKHAGHGGRPWFRPPFGRFDDGVLRDISEAGFSWNVMWSVDGRGWDGRSEDSIVERVLTSHDNGNIYIFHVASSNEGPALPRILAGLRDLGYGFATVEDLVRAGNSHSAFRKHVVASARNGQFSHNEIKRARALAERNSRKVAQAMSRANDHGRVTAVEVDRIVSLGTA